MTDEQIVQLYYAAQGDITRFRIKARALLAASAPNPSDKQEAVAWVYCDTLHAEHCHLSDRDAIEDGWLPLVYASHAGFARDDIRELAVKFGFQYWRASDAHGVNGTIKEAEELLADLLGVEVEIGGSKAQALDAAPFANPSAEQEAKRMTDEYKYVDAKGCCYKSPCEHPGEGPCERPARRVDDREPVGEVCTIPPFTRYDKNGIGYKAGGVSTVRLFKDLPVGTKLYAAQSAEQDRIDAERYRMARKKRYINRVEEHEIDTFIAKGASK